MAKPMPEPPPVIRETFPCSEVLIIERKFIALISHAFHIRFFSSLARDILLAVVPAHHPARTIGTLSMEAEGC
jgi:hypothetical protein